MTSLIYIMGAGHSGSSLLDLSLGALTGVRPTGELNRLTLEPTTDECACGATLDHCPRWLRLRSEVIGSANSWGAFPSHISPQRIPSQTLPSFLALSEVVTPGRLQAGKLQLAREHGMRAWSIVDSLGRVESADWVVDSTKSISRAAVLRGLRPDIFYIHLVRHPRAIYHSATQRGADPIAAVTRWVEVNLGAASLCRLHGRRRAMLVRYEDFCKQPGYVLRMIADAVGCPQSVPADPTPIAPGHQIPGNRRMLSNTIEDIELRESWRESEAASIQLPLTAKLLARQLGYE